MGYTQLEGEAMRFDARKRKQSEEGLDSVPSTIKAMISTVLVVVLLT